MADEINIDQFGQMDEEKKALEAKLPTLEGELQILSKKRN